MQVTAQLQRYQRYKQHYIAIYRPVKEILKTSVVWRKILRLFNFLFVHYVLNNNNEEQKKDEELYIPYGNNSRENIQQIALK